MSVPIERLAAFLGRHLEWWRHRPEVAEFLADIADVAGRMRGLVDGPGRHRYLGPCGAPTGDVEADCPVNCECHNGLHHPCSEPGGCGSAGCGRQTECPGDVHARPGAAEGQCRTCRAVWPVDERRAWLDAEVRARAFRAAEIADAYGLKANTIRVWHTRGRLLAVSRDRDGRPLFLVGEVLDLAAQDAARRESRRAERERLAARAAERMSE